MPELDPILVLDIIGALVLLAGVVLHFAGRKFGGTLAVLGVLWLFTMGIYYWFSASGFYGPTGGIVVEKAGYLPNAIGVALLIVGIAIGAYAVRRARGG